MMYSDNTETPLLKIGTEQTKVKLPFSSAMSMSFFDNALRCKRDHEVCICMAGQVGNPSRKQRRWARQGVPHTHKSARSLRPFFLSTMYGPPNRSVITASTTTCRDRSANPNRFSVFRSEIGSERKTAHDLGIKRTVNPEHFPWKVLLRKERARSRKYLGSFLTELHPFPT